MKDFKVDRRTFLRGTGVSIALPLLEAMIPRVARGAAVAGEPQRMILLYHPNGYPYAPWDGWKQKYAWRAGLARLGEVNNGIDIRGDYTVVSGLKNRPGEIQHDKGGGDGHGDGSVTVLSAAPADKLGDKRWAVKQTFDQLIAQEKYGNRPLSSMGILVQPGYNMKGAYTGIYNVCMSWKGPEKPLEFFVNPRDVFTKLFGAAPGITTMAAVSGGPNILDLVAGDIQSLKKRLGRDDVVRLEEYLTGVREIQARLGQLPSDPSDPGTGGGTLPPNTGGGTPSSCSGLSAFNPPNVKEPDMSTYAERLELYKQLMVKAFECDRTRLFNLMLGAEELNMKFMGVSRSWHNASHGNFSDGGKDEKANSDNVKIGLWAHDQFKDICWRLKQKRDPSGRTMLDNSAVVMFSNCIGDGGSHHKSFGQITLGGRLGGALKTGLGELNLSQSGGVRPLADLWLTLIQGFGVNKSSFGDSTGTISQLVG